ncbi:MAG TPA: tRNA epoxyqueuosine(34) reductase QueG [Tepidisphaeraceae bacterium]|jgi:epoxyqueuosine reductase|nr:tRNA epoxyqueuosine(34) reductase QueG [Tepidisphaeraceae bacterium]
MTATPLDNLIDHALAANLKEHARRLGFDLVGIAAADRAQWGSYFRQWIDQGQAGEMRYLANRMDERTDPRTYVPGAKSVICVAMNYHVTLEPVPEPEREHHGRIARYALGEDYHELLKSRLHALADWLREAVPGAQTRACVDTAPVMEKEFAARAGVGWLGKNTCLISPKIGSWLLLGEIVTTALLPIDEPATDHCGTCTRCIDACPTNAITAPYQLDARRCISYLTIEHRGPIAPELQPQIGDWLYGCDICQDVCPHNRKAPSTPEAALQPRFPTGSLDVRDVLSWSADEYRARLRGSAMKRVKLPVLQRNAKIVADNAQRKEPGS